MLKMKILRRAIRRAYDFYRTAPAGETAFALTAGSTAMGVLYASDNFKRGLIISAGVLCSIPQLILVAHQFYLKSRLERSIKNHGYREGAFSKTLKNWCDRQTAGVVAEKYGYLEQYIDLVKKSRR